VTANPTRPEVASVSAGPRELSLTLKVPASLPWFRGHFEHYPILPGVVQLAWAMAFAQEHFCFDAAVERIAALKFMRVIQPDAELKLDLNWSADQRALDFRYSERDTTCSSGRFILAR
jgi:3-hydroxymyristoyl/3-hydroxydecanoyl-(acyl carrier protein) dehydratase